MNSMINFVCTTWGYLLVDNLEYWYPFFPQFCNSIRQRVERNVGDVVTLEEDLENGFSIVGFIDNTISAICRPGGGPAPPGGPGAPRYDPQLQQAFYTRYKKLHGVKFQAIVLPNGMFLHVHGAMEARHHDIENLRSSMILQNLFDLQNGQAAKYTIHGDGAYNIAHRMITGGGVACRVSCEWDFGEFKQLFATIDYQKMLRLRENHVASIIFASMWLFNAHVAMNGNEVSRYFNDNPPELEDWMASGPAHSNHPWLRNV